MTIKPVLVPDHDAAELRRLMDSFAEASTGTTRQQLTESRAAVTAARKTFAESSDDDEENFVPQIYARIIPGTKSYEIIKVLDSNLGLKVGDRVSHMALTRGTFKDIPKNLYTTIRRDVAEGEQTITEGFMDIVKQAFNDCVVGYPMGTSDEEFIQGWADAIREETGRDIPVEKLAKLYHDYAERSDEIMRSHGTLDEGKWNYPPEYTKKANADDEAELGVSLINKDARKAWRKKQKARAHKDLMTGKNKEPGVAGEFKGELDSKDRFTKDTVQKMFGKLSPDAKGVAEGQDDNGISFQIQKGKNKFATTLSIGNNSVGVYQYDANTGRSIAEVYPEFKGKGLGKLLVLHAIYTAAKLGLDFQEDESRTSEYDNVLDSLSGSGYIVDDEGYWYVTGEGEQFLKQSLKQGVAEGSDKYAELSKKIRDLAQAGKEGEANKLRYELNRLLMLDRDKQRRKQQGVAEGEGMSRAAKGYEKYGQEGMAALAKAGREGRALDPVRQKYDRYDEAVAEAGRPDVMRHAGDTTVKVVKRGGKPIGEIGIDAEASEGNGQYYVKLYDGSYDAVGFDTAAEALAELKYAIKSAGSGPDTSFGGPSGWTGPVGETSAADGVKYGVFAKGGSVGSQRFRDDPVKTFDTKEEAVADARRRRSGLSKGERGYYRMGYVVKPIKGEVDEGLKSKLAGVALAGAAALGGGGAGAQTTDRFDPAWRTSGYDTSIRSDVSSTKSMNTADPSKDVNDFQKRIQSVTGPNAKGEYKVVVIQGNDIVSHYVTKTPPPGWLYKEDAAQQVEESVDPIEQLRADIRRFSR